MSKDIDQLFNDISDRHSAATERLKQRIPEEINLYTEILKQRDMAASKALHDLLDAEIKAYQLLNVAWNDYMNTQADLANHNAAIKNLLESGHPCPEELKVMYLLNYVIPLTNSMELYMLTVNRDFKDWREFRKKLAETGAGIITGPIPVVSEIISLLDTMVQITDLVKEYKADGTDYSAVDRQLFCIEVHTEMMKRTAKLFQNQAKVLTEAAQKSEHNPLKEL